jgi:poly-beta-1,6 N-acetyl-D-glucosamine synthase
VVAKLRYAASLLGVLVVLAGGALMLHVGVRNVEWDLSGSVVRFSMWILLVFLMLLMARYLALLWFSYLDHLEGSETQTATALPQVTVIVPAYNEGRVIQGSIRSLLALDYPRYEILVIDDGSSDDTFKQARAFEGTHGRATVRVIRKRNGGKSRALNTGIARATSDFILCMDGDSALHPQTLRRAIPHLVANPGVGAVAGSVKVVNRGSFLAKLQALEYVEGLNMVRSAQAFFRLVNIIPGPIGIFRRSALERVGAYDHDTFAEDCDLTLKLIADGWQVRYEPGAVAYTEAPEGLLDLLKQRYRWTRGILQAIRKHRGALIGRSGLPLLFTLWYMIFEGIMWPVMNVFANVLFVIVATKYGMALPLILWFAQLTVLDLAAALYCVAAEEESMSLVPYAIWYRLFFALTIDVAKLLATFEECLQLKMEWGKLDRLGRI